MDAYLWKSYKGVDLSAAIICLESDTLSLPAEFQKVGTPGGCKELRRPLGVRLGRAKILLPSKQNCLLLL